MAIEDRLRQSMLRAIQDQDLDRDRILIQEIATDLGIDFLDCAAALMHLYQIRLNEDAPGMQANILGVPLTDILSPAAPKMIRYRLEVGRKHSVSKEELKDTLVEESGVDRKMIGTIEMQHHFTLVELPEGMPNDIFHHLKTVEINHHKLHIKRAGKTPPKKRGSAIKRGKHRTSQTPKQADSETVKEVR